MKHHLRHIAVVGIAAVCLAIAACAPSTSSGPAAPKESAKSTAASPQSITIKGSDTMVHLVTAWAEAYMKAHPEVEISVTGGGSGTGISALLGGSTDICAASRDMTAQEREKASQKGINPYETTVARDGIAVIVHPSNPIQDLTMEQVRKIYTGANTNWNQVGGTDGEFVILSRETSSGTYVFFQEHVLQKQDYAATVRLMPATSSIIQSASEDALAIGYVGLGYALEAGAKVKILPIKADADAPAVIPTEETVKDASYSISRALYFYTNEAPSGVVQGFVEFCLSPAGQDIARETGYVPVN